MARFLQSPSLRDSLLKYRNETPPSVDPWTEEGLEAIAGRKTAYRTVMASLLRLGDDDQAFRERLGALRALEAERRPSGARRRGRPSQEARIPWASEHIALAWQEEEPKRRAIDLILAAYEEGDFAAAKRLGRSIAKAYESGDAAETRVAVRLN